MNVNASKPRPLSWLLATAPSKSKRSFNLGGCWWGDECLCLYSFFFFFFFLILTFTFVHVAQMSIALGHHILPHVRAKGSGKRANG